MSAITESVFTIMTSHVCCEKFSELQRFKAGSLSLVRQRIPQHNNTPVFKSKWCKRKVARKHIYESISTRMRSASLLLLYLCEWVSLTDTTPLLCSSSSAPHETRNPERVMWNKCLHPSWKLHCCDVCKSRLHYSSFYFTQASASSLSTRICALEMSTCILRGSGCSVTRVEGAACFWKSLFIHTKDWS